MLIVLSQPLPAEQALHVVKPQQSYLSADAAHVLPFGYVLIEYLLYLPCVQLFHRVRLVDNQRVALLYRLRREKSQSLREQEHHNKQNDNTCKESAACYYPGGNPLYNLPHFLFFNSSAVKLYLTYHEPVTELLQYGFRMIKHVISNICNTIVSPL